MADRELTIHLPEELVEEVRRVLEARGLASFDAATQDALRAWLQQVRLEAWSQTLAELQADVERQGNLAALGQTTEEIVDNLRELRARLDAPDQNAG
jgi:Arc/MetJ-type ribon-helix-helix transcriptional regulator